MKRLPVIAGLSTVAFLITCFFQARGRGDGFVPPLTEWELHPAWWHLNFLADCADFLILAPAFYIVLLLGSAVHFFGIDFSERVLTSIAWVSVAVPIVIESLLVFYLMRVLLSRMSKRPNQSLQPTAGRSDE